MADSGTSTKPSRYRSTRQRQHSTDETQWPEQQPPSSPSDDAIARIKSRYHRKQGSGTASSLPETRAASQQHTLESEVPSRYHAKPRDSPLTPLYQEQVVQAPLQAQRTTSMEYKRSYSHNTSPPVEAGARDPRRVNSDELDSDEEDKRRQLSRNRWSNRRNQEEASPPSLATGASQPPGELFPPPKPAEEPLRRDGPPQSGQIRATKSMNELPTFEEEDSGCFGGLFKRKRGEAVPSAADTKKPIARPKPAKDEPVTIRPGGGGIVPGIDAPKSAVNAGDRQVMVECNKTSKRLFAVTPTTTAADIIKSAATCMAERIDVKSAVLLETFASVGVQRPLRRYEPIRDVMNSWDSDKQNSLLIVDPGTGSVEPELTITGAPRDQPGDQSWNLSYSQKVGKWEKRFVTLRSDGQVICQKDPNKPKDAVNICHLSDFDIYTPTPDKVKKKIKPPKKQCYAIKSQQKTTMFESTHDFVHFFSTGDRATGDNFYEVIQSWRSWYLVHVRGEGNKEPAQQVQTLSEPKERSTSNEKWKTHRTKESMESHYQLGSFKPVFDMDQFEKHTVPPAQSDSSNAGVFTKSANQFDVNVSPERRTSTAKRQLPPMALNNKPILAEDEPLANLNRSSSVSKRRPSTEQRRPDTSEFRDTGLLGRNYSQRRKETAEKEQAFTGGPSLLNGGMSDRHDSAGYGDGLQRRHSTRKYASNSEMKWSSSTRESPRGHGRGGSVELERSNSRRQKPKPLIDLTPEYKEPPQHSKKGRGYRPENIPIGGLINSATSPEDPLGIPNATVFRNTSGQYAPPSPCSPGLIDLTPQHNEPVHHARKGRGHLPEGQQQGGLVMNASSPEDPLGVPQNNTFRSVNAMPEGRRRAGSSSEPTPPPQRQLSVRKKQDAFTGEGLLGAASNRQGWGTTDKGRGVIDGSRAGGKPLVDLTADSQFVQGSLLNKVERSAGIPAPIIDREKRDEVNQKYGEGY